MKKPLFLVMLCRIIHGVTFESPRELVNSMLILFFFTSLNAQDGYPGIAGARGLAMGHTGMVFTDIHSLFSNPAGLARIDRFSAVATAEQRFLVQEMRQISAAAGLPVAGGAFGMRVQYYGFDLYNEQQIGLTYARRLSEGFQIGAQFIYFGNRIPSYGNRHLVTFQFGLQAQLLPQLQIGASVYNPLRLERSEEGELLPTLFGIGIGYTPAPQLLLTLEAEKDIDFPVRVKGGAEYRIADPLLLRLGAATNPSLFTFGFGLRLKNGIGIDLASSWHQYLGFTPGISLLYAGSAGKPAGN